MAIADVVLHISGEKPNDWNIKDKKDKYFWLWQGFLKLIAIEFKPGRHRAETPLEFLPIIKKLEMLHGKGYVHGDIRAFNVVFDGKGNGWLIDFDLGGKVGKKCPQGYHRNLDDGIRLGNGESKDPNISTLQYFHDWYALGYLMFDIHKCKPPSDADPDDLLQDYRAKDIMLDWMNLNGQPSSKKIAELKTLLQELDDRKWTVSADQNFLGQLELVGDGERTKAGATGSPL